jgi:hypothetical protein
LSPDGRFLRRFPVWSLGWRFFDRWFSGFIGRLFDRWLRRRRWWFRRVSRFLDWRLLGSIRRFFYRRLTL